jgi:hypothetical protein
MRETSCSGREPFEFALAPGAAISRSWRLFVLHVHILFASVHLGFGLLAAARLCLGAAASTGLAGGTSGRSLCLGLFSHCSAPLGCRYTGVNPAHKVRRSGNHRHRVFRVFVSGLPRRRWKMASERLISLFGAGVTAIDGFDDGGASFLRRVLGRFVAVFFDFVYLAG